MSAKKSLLFFISSAFIIFNGCKKPLPPPCGGEEVITTFTYTLTSANGLSTVLYFHDLDGDGGELPILQSGSLKANTTYLGTIELLNESCEDAPSIRNEIKAAAATHQLFFNSTIDGIEVKYEDFDENGDPLGLDNTLTTGKPGIGVLTITLRHQPNKSAEGVNEGIIKNAGGETDIELTFDIEVQ